MNDAIPSRTLGGEGAAMAGLRSDRAPPLAIPASFFLLAPAAMLAADHVSGTTCPTTAAGPAP